MARGRKKGGLKINSINDREELTKMIINQINSVNKKIKKFKSEGIEEHSEYIKTLISSDMGQFTPNDTLSKSKKFYESKNTVWLKKTLAALHKINNHEYFGTINKYKKEVSTTIKNVQDYAKEYLREKGYDEKFIIETINSKSFMVNLFDAYKDVGKGYGSNQAIEKVALSYGTNTGFSEQEMNKILNNIEHGKNTLDRIKEEQDAFNEFLNMRNNAKR